MSEEIKEAMDEVQLPPIEEQDLPHVAEALLFASGDPLPTTFLVRTLNLTPKNTRDLMDALIADYDERHTGMRIVRVGDAYQMTSRPDFYPYIKVMFTSRAAQIRLTDTQMETLSIIAYRQPVTKMEIEDIRGVHSDAVVNRLVEYGLVEEKGRLKAPGRPIQFGTSDVFLKYFGMADLSEMPHLAQAERDRREEPNTQMDLADLSVVDEKYEDVEADGPKPDAEEET